MSSLRSLLLLVIVGGLALFVLQNWTPVLPLVLLGIPTQPIPLAFWMVGSIAIGAVTTIIIAALFRITAFTAAPRQRRPRGQSNTPSPPDRSIDPRNRPYSATSPRTTMQSDDDWEESREAWDDWETPAATEGDRPVRDTVPPASNRPPVDFRIDDFQTIDRPVDNRRADDRSFWAEERQEEREEEPVYPASSEPPVYDAPYEVYRPAYRSLDEPYEPSYEPSYSEPEYVQPEYVQPEYSEPLSSEPEPEVWDDWEEREDIPIAPPEPQRPIVEVQQMPKSEYRSGTVYSYSYRGEDESPKPDRSAENPSDSEPERVIIPPAPADVEEDWGFADDEEEDEEDEDETDTRSPRSNRDQDW